VVDDVAGLNIEGAEFSPDGSEMDAPGRRPRPAATQHLWAWNGEPDTQPRRLATPLPADAEPNHSLNSGAWEGIGELPERLAPGAKVRLIMDQGYGLLYGDQMENKDDSVNWSNKGPNRSGHPGRGRRHAGAAVSVGSAKKVTVTNTGSNLLHIGPAYTSDEDGESATDFLVAANTCRSSATSAAIPGGTRRPPQPGDCSTELLSQVGGLAPRAQ
jgi:hypothetical protein